MSFEEAEPFAVPALLVLDSEPLEALPLEEERPASLLQLPFFSAVRNSRSDPGTQRYTRSLGRVLSPS